MYSERLIITVPDTLADVAAKIGKALDPDTGGEYSFHDNGDGSITANTPCEPSFKEYAEYLMTSPSLLHEELLKAYAERWADLIPPTLEECSLFISSIIKENINAPE